MKICLTTFVQRHLYQEYLPMLIYSIGKAYPEYDVKIFLHDTLRDDLRPALDMIRSTYDRFEIREHTFADCPNMNSLVARSLRWVLWDESFRPKTVTVLILGLFILICSIFVSPKNSWNNISSI